MSNGSLTWMGSEFAASLQETIEKLNEPQRRAVEYGEGPLLVSAGAGTGKTRVLTLRYASLVARGASHPACILAVTFTNKAAQEMRNRLETLFGTSLKSFWIGTFHSISLRLLRAHTDLCGRAPGFSVLDEGDRQRLMKKVLKALSVPKEYTPSVVLSKISRYKQYAYGPDDIPVDEDPLIRTIFATYQEYLRDVNGFDFDDLLVESLRLLQDNEEVLKRYQDQFRYILVDEYQDINHVQYLWIRALARGHQNLCCVGDDDQSIYGWRGANVENILRFTSDFGGATIIALEQNYRSTPHILSAASHLIANNGQRHGKTLHTDKTHGEKVRVQSVWDAEEEAAWVAQEILAIRKACADENDEPFSSMAILVRAGFQMREFEERFILLGLPYRIVGSARFYERQEIRDIIGYFRVVQSPQDNLAFERILNVPKRGIGSATLKELYESAEMHEESLENACRRACAEKRGIRGEEALKTFLRKIDSWRAMARMKPALPSLADRIFDESGYAAMLKADPDPQSEGRIENVKDLIRAMEQFHTLEEFLEHMALLAETVDNKTTDAVSVMTLHAAKGLEFDTVFLAGWEEQMFPHPRCLSESGNKGLEEERRLAYVGITRAKKRSIISFCQNRRLPSQGWTSSVPSRFIWELPQTDVAFSERVSTASQQKRSFGNNPKWRNAPIIEKPMSQPAMSAQRVASSQENVFRIGARVVHPIFGKGTVKQNQGTILYVVFDTHAAKKVSARFVEAI